MSSPNRTLFRKEALAKLSSPDRLDLPMPVTSPLGWLVLLAIGFLLAVIVAWSLLGTIPRKVGGQGILLRDSQFGLMDVTASSSGDVAEILKDENAIVQRGEVVATIDQYTLADQIEGLKHSLELARAQNNQQREAEDDQLRALRDKLRNQEQLQARGLVTRSTVLETKSQIYNFVSQGHAREQKLLELEERIEQEESRLRRDSVVRSQHDGAVIEVLVDPGDTVREGSRIVTLESLTGEHEVVAFVPAGEGKKIHEGMTAQVSPSTVKAEEYGYLLGKVVDVSNFPVTTEYIRKLIRNDKLVETLTAQGPVIEVTIELMLDPSTTSGFAWTSPGGPPFQIEGGTTCGVTIVSERLRPITLLLPYLRKQLGFY